MDLRFVPEGLPGRQIGLVLNDGSDTRVVQAVYASVMLNGLQVRDRERDEGTIIRAAMIVEATDKALRKERLTYSVPDARWLIEQTSQLASSTFHDAEAISHALPTLTSADLEAQKRVAGRIILGAHASTQATRMQQQLDELVSRHCLSDRTHLNAVPQTGQYL